MKLRKLSAGLLGLFLIGIFFVSCQKKTQAGVTVKSGVLSIGMEIGYPPMEYYDADGKTPIGFDVIMGKAIAEKLGLKTEFIDTAWDGIFAGLDTGKYDCIMSAATVTPERQAAYNFTKPYIGNAQALVLLKDSPVKAKSIEELVGLRVAYQAETTSDIYMTKLAEGGFAFEPFEYDKVMNCFDDLRLGRVDAVVCDSLVAVDYIAPENTPFQIVWQGPADEVFAIFLKKGNDSLTAKIDEALDELFANNSMVKISQDIFKIDMVSGSRKN